ncbi:MAG: peroxidase family protein, partial [Gammaproteobacteria bacterium]|nr:peroxidase family protein [Gammaproteobacteria bacterium]
MNYRVLVAIVAVLWSTALETVAHTNKEELDEVLMESSDDAVRKQAINEAITETQLYIQSLDEQSAVAIANLRSKAQMAGAESVLFKLFKIPSQKAVEHGKARIAYEEMVRRAERKLLEPKSTTYKYHEVGTVLTSSELAELFEVSGCRRLLASPNCSTPAVNLYRSIDGTCNNLQNPLWGAATTAFRRILPPYYEDGISSIRGYLQNYAEAVLPIGPFVPPVPSPRIVSTNIVSDRSLDETSVSHMVMQFGQFLNHDINRAAGLQGTCNNCQNTDVCLPIRVSAADEQFGTGTQNGGQCLSFIRSVPACTGSSSPFEVGGRQQINDVTTFIDGSMIYGSDASLAAQLREFSGGRLRVGQPIPPRAKSSLPLDPSACPGCFLAGDTRANEQIGLTTLHTIFMREHNRVANALASINPKWNDEKLYQEARKIVGAEIQRITYYEFLPAVMGQSFNNMIGQYGGYNPLINPSSPTEFSTAAYRFGHSLVRPSFSLLDRMYLPFQNGNIPLQSAFANPSMYAMANGTDQILRGLLNTKSRRSDEFLVSALTTQLLEISTSNSGYPGGTGRGTDLASLNIQRGRDHGLPPYSTVRNYCQRITGIKPTFKNDITLIRALETYGSLDTADLWPLGLAETPIPGSLIGPTFSCLFADAFKALRNGDRFYFENSSVFNSFQLAEIRKSTMSRIICDNADDITTIEPKAFLISGSRTSCSNLASPDLSVWKDGYQPQNKQCAFNVRVGSFP